MYNGSISIFLIEIKSTFLEITLKVTISLLSLWALCLSGSWIENAIFHQHSRKGVRSLQLAGGLGNNSKDCIYKWAVVEIYNVFYWYIYFHDFDSA